MVTEFIMTAYERLFLVFFRWSERVNGRESHNVYYASLMLGLALLVNAASVLLVAEILFDQPLLQAVSSVSKLLLTPLVVLYFWLNYHYFRSGNRYQRIVDAHARDGQGSDAFLGRIGGIYALISVFLLIALLFIRLEYGPSY